RPGLPAGSRSRPPHGMNPMKQTLIATFIAGALLAGAPMLASAQPQASSQAVAGSPSRLVLDNATRILTTLEARRGEFTSDRSAFNTEINSFADAIINDQMQRFGSSLLDFNLELQVRVKSETPLRGSTKVKVYSEFLRQGGKPIPVDYLMRKSSNEWKVFDVMV